MICFAENNTHDDLVLGNLGLCRFVVNRAYSQACVRSLGYETAVAVCEAELVVAAQSYRSDRGASFSSWAIRLLQSRLFKEANAWQRKSGRQLAENYDVAELDRPDSPYDLELLPLMLDALPKRQRALIERYYGIGQPARNMTELAVDQGVTKQRIMRLITAAKQTMRDSLKRSPRD